jgi:hypothetical protein
MTMEPIGSLWNGYLGKIKLAGTTPKITQLVGMELGMAIGRSDTIRR